MTKRVAVIVLLLALTGCRPAPPVAGPAPPPSPLSDAPPNEVSGLDIPAGRIDDAMAKVDGLVDDLMKNSGIPGMAVAIVHGGKTLYAKGFGVKDASKGDAADNKVDADTVFQLASMSKSVGATVVAHEVTDNVVGWDTPVVSKLPVVRAVGSLRHQQCDHRRPVLASLRAARPRRRQTGGSRTTTGDRRWSGCGTCRWRRFESATPTPTSG